MRNRNSRSLVSNTIISRILPPLGWMTARHPGSFLYSTCCSVAHVASSKFGVVLVGIALLFGFEPAPAGQVHYDDKFVNTFGQAGWSWATIVNENWTGNVYDGSSAIRAQFLGSWSGFSSSVYPFLSTKGADSVCMNIGAENLAIDAADIVIKLKDSSGTDIGNGISLFSYVPYDSVAGGAIIQPGAWRRTCVPLSFLGGVDRDIQSTMVLNGSPLGPQAVFLDNISWSFTGNASPGSLFAEGPAVGVINESWSYWHDAGWSRPPLTSSTNVHHGEQSFWAFFNGQWEALRLRGTGGIAIKPEETLTLWVKKNTDANRLQDLRVRLRGVTNGPIGPEVGLGDYLSFIVAGEWLPVSIPLTDLLNQSLTSIGAVEIMSTAAGIGDVYFDDMSITDAVFRMPLRQNKDWQVTSTVGDLGCTREGGLWGEGTATHENNNFYSIDFNDISRQFGHESNVPVFAAGDGIAEVPPFAAYAGGGYSGDRNGWSLVIHHPSGYQTRYLHLAQPPMVSNGQTVTVDKQIGYVGESGLYLPNGPGSRTHLHFGVRWDPDGQGGAIGDGGLSAASNLDRVRLEGIPLRAYETACTANSSPYATGISESFYPGSSIIQ